jgi:hypothetical protein
MNNPQAPLRWRLEASIGPELVALGITVLLAIVILVGLIRGGSPSGGGPSPTPDPSHVTSVLEVGSQTSRS